MRHSRGGRDTNSDTIARLIGLEFTSLSLLVCCASLTLAQDPSAARYPSIEISTGYSAIETNDHSFQFANIGPVRNLDFDEGGFGFEAAVIRNLSRWVGIMGDFSAHFSSDKFPVTVAMPCSLPPCASASQPGSINPRLFNFLAGPEIKWRNRTRFTPFVHALAGVAHSTATFSTSGPLVNLSRTDAETGFAMSLGGGVDVRISRRFSFRGGVMYGQSLVGSSALPRQKVDYAGWSSGVLFTP